MPTTDGGVDHETVLPNPVGNNQTSTRSQSQGNRSRASLVLIMWPYTEDELIIINQGCHWWPVTDEEWERLNFPERFQGK